MAKKNIKVTDSRPFGDREAEVALDRLLQYKQGKASIDLKARDNQEWWRLRHWDVISRETNEGKKAGNEVGSAWTVNSIANKHADIMDSFPKPNILAREADDEAEAKTLSEIIPCVLEQNDYERVYRQLGWDFVIDGAAITAVLWDSSVNDGLGDIAIRNIDVHNLFWQPGIEDIQDSKAVFYVKHMDVEDARTMYPEFAKEIEPSDSGTVVEYIHDDNVDRTQQVEAVDCYYKRTVPVPILRGVLNEATGETRQVAFHKAFRTVVHLAKIVGGKLVWCSENEKGYEKGFYEHGKYPFVVRKMFPVKDSVWAFGYLDIMKNPQKDIDKIDQAIIKNSMQKTKQRFFVSDAAGINKEDLADWDKEVIGVSGSDVGSHIMQMQVDTVPSAAFQHYANKIDELKETSGNRDFSQGSTSSGVTAASAIAALQEAGSKLSRDINKELYRGFREEVYLTIELMRQFYNDARPFRITSGTGQTTYVSYSNINLVPQDIETELGTRHRKPIFDIEVSAEKQSPFSRAAQNETAKEMYSMGFFNPQMAEQSLACIDMMEFEGKDSVINNIQRNSFLYNQLNACMAFIAQLANANPEIGAMAMQAGLLQAEESPLPNASAKGSGTPEEKAAGVKTDNSLATQARKRAASASTPR